MTADWENEGGAPEAQRPYRRPPPRSELLWVGVDLDDTLARSLWSPENPTTEIGDPIWANVYKLRQVVTEGYRIHIHSSRPWTDYEAIKGWLRHWDIPFDQIQLGKPLYILYVDDKARNADAESWLP